MKEFADILKEFLGENHLTQVAFAQKVGIKQGQVSEWLCGKSKPGYDNLKMIATAFNISADYFFQFEDKV